ncbi:Zn-ribbon domain-containing OB-fold protein [Homoserinibacter sp. YIM 151385]|uniref:Zn-ribbon domain-containing OB-fold protein n=1 Tax=Homoserinibacter sp. YIM 151385 TaxID=2985506 RepID=UPI0022F00D18|nr:OB-fold domain-containing protein [Homoserinibacter sp. YIM 151385]WBU37100.1 OB-fold domain-containing protein [Homoserinibacter sp. YIM 151385]
MSPATRRPHPALRGEEQVFYDALREHRLVYQRCAEDAAVVFPLRTVCPRCGGAELALETSAGLGVVHSHTTQYRAGSPILGDLAPYALALVDLDEGFRVLTSVPEGVEVAVGTPVRIAFDDGDPELTVLAVELRDPAEEGAA